MKKKCDEGADRTQKKIIHVMKDDDARQITPFYEVDIIFIEFSI